MPAILRNLSKLIARRLALPFLRLLRYDTFLLSKSRKTRCIVNFHGVRTGTERPFNNRHIPLKEFEKLLVYLKRNFQIVSLDEIFSPTFKLAADKKKAIALTFDDGYQNNFDLALPLLEKYSLPATFFIISQGLYDSTFVVWPDVIDYLKTKVKKDVNLDGYVFKAPQMWCEDLKVDLLNYIKSTGKRAVEITKELQKEYAIDESELQRNPVLTRLVDKTRLAATKNRLVSFGSHTHSHFNLEYLDDEISMNELQTSKHLLEETTGKTVTSLAFPDGSYSDKTAELALAAGYKYLLAVDYKTKNSVRSPSILPRFTISNTTTANSNILRLAKQFDKYGFNDVGAK